MKVLHVHNQASFQGGVERILFDTAVGLAGRGWTQGLFLADRGVASDASFTEPFEQVVRSRGEIQRFAPDVLLMHKIDDANLIAELAEQYPCVRMVHDHDLTCLRRHKYFPLSQRVCHLPTGVDCYTHGCFVQRAAPGSMLPVTLKSVRSQRRLLNAHARLRRFITISEAMVDELFMNGIERRRIDKIHPIPAALSEIEPLPAAHEPRILFVGQLIRGKGVDLMIRALGELSCDWYATIVGDGHHLEECKQLARDMGIDHLIDFTGRLPHNELQRHYAAARFSVVPSRWPEPFGMVGIEAMARSRPVVAFDVGGIPDWLDDEVSGLLVPEADVDQLAAAMQRLLDDQKLAQTLGRQALQEVVARFRHADYLDKIQASLRAANTAEEAEQS